ncbi:hypothetical protein [Mangrovicoccus algicola]|uniref:Flagellar protein FlgN n=1 Tax=Mangrovicoccus algicola TaxID=2771008 RepID=A0A8J6YWP8_9RHOB|nr:hypothetical protein [Mangrovicoccus algicola]MBE3639280.1 hypothetical protein [Mangrovicoccus algicola]
MTPAATLAALLRRQGDALLCGDLDSLRDLAGQLEQACDRLDREGGVSRAELAAINGMARRNMKLIDAARSGASAVERRLKDIADLSGGQRVYGARGGARLLHDGPAGQARKV